MYYTVPALISSPILDAFRALKLTFAQVLNALAALVARPRSATIAYGVMFERFRSPI
jgi:hypothetical protein